MNSILFSPGDHAGLAEAVHRLAEDPALRASLVESGRRTAERYDVDHMADAYEKRFEEQAFAAAKLQG